MTSHEQSVAVVDERTKILMRWKETHEDETRVQDNRLTVLEEYRNNHNKETERLVQESKERDDELCERVTVVEDQMQVVTKKIDRFTWATSGLIILFSTVGKVAIDLVIEVAKGFIHK
jgi:hypothetical protein